MDGRRFTLLCQGALDGNWYEVYLSGKLSQQGCLHIISEKYGIYVYKKLVVK